MRQGVKYVSCGPKLSFMTLKSKFNCITKEFCFSILVIFGDFGSKSRENIYFLPIYKDLQEILWSNVLLPYFKYFLSKTFLSSLEFSNY